MKKLIASLALSLGLIAATAAQENDGAKTLVMYFSWGGTTEKMAEMIAESTGADLWKIESEKKYPSIYPICGYVVKRELDKGIIRQVKGSPDFSKYDTVFVGCPVWWHTAPTLVTNFLHEHTAELNEKTVIPFCTYASTSRAETLSALMEATEKSEHREGLGLTKPSQEEVAAWLKKIGM